MQALALVLCSSCCTVAIYGTILIDDIRRRAQTMMPSSWSKHAKDLVWSADLSRVRLNVPTQEGGFHVFLSHTWRFGQ
eukprot:2849517-Prymnesium_polylepis.1